MVHELCAKVGSRFLTLLREITTIPLCLHRLVPAFHHLRRNWLHRHLLLNLNLRHIFTFLLQDPIINRIIVPALLAHEALPQASQIVVIWFLVKFEASAILQVLRELLRAASTKHFDRRCDLLFLDSVVFVILCLSLKALPRQGPFQKVQKNVTNRLQVISSGLLHTDVRINGSVPRRSSQGLAIPVGYMLA